MLDTLTFKSQSLYIAFVPQTGAWAAGGCFEEAVNTLSDQLRAKAIDPEQGTGEENGAQ
jgi:hypothetical protein